MFGYITVFCLKIDNLLFKVLISNCRIFLSKQFQKLTLNKLLPNICFDVWLSLHDDIQIILSLLFLSMCSVPCKFNYTCEPRKLVDPLGLNTETIIEDVNYKIEEFLIELKYAIEKSNRETDI